MWMRAHPWYQLPPYSSRSNAFFTASEFCSHQDKKCFVVRINTYRKNETKYDKRSHPGFKWTLFWLYDVNRAHFDSQSPQTYLHNMCFDIWYRSFCSCLIILPNSLFLTKSAFISLTIHATRYTFTFLSLAWQCLGLGVIDLISRFRCTNQRKSVSFAKERAKTAV